MDEDELVALNSWRRIDRQTREAIKRNFLPDLLEIYEVLSYLLQFNSTSPPPKNDYIFFPAPKSNHVSSLLLKQL